MNLNHDPLEMFSRKQTYLGFDFGIKKTGAAVGQLETRIANPLETIRTVRQKPDWNAISRLVRDWRPRGFVVGIARRSDGGENPVTKPIMRFCRQLEGRFRLPVHCVDETLTTYESKQLLFDEVKVHAHKLWQVQDQLAAQLILQTWLNQHQVP